MKQTRKIAILGGTFNPIHLGHLLIEQDAMAEVARDLAEFLK